MDSAILLELKLEPLAEGGFPATNPDLPGLVMHGRTRAETMEQAQANARILTEVYLSEKLPCPPLLRRISNRKPRTVGALLPVAMPFPA